MFLKFYWCAIHHNKIFIYTHSIDEFLPPRFWSYPLPFQLPILFRYSHTPYFLRDSLNSSLLFFSTWKGKIADRKSKSSIIRAKSLKWISKTKGLSWPQNAVGLMIEFSITSPVLSSDKIWINSNHCFITFCNTSKKSSQNRVFQNWGLLTS